MEENQQQNHLNNVLLFRLAISNCFEHIAESVSEDAFLETLTILKSKPNVVKKLHKAMIKELHGSMNDDLEDVLNEGSLQEGLGKISRISDADSSVSEDAWRPPGDVSLHLRSFDAQKIKEESELLAKRVSEMEEENAILMEKIANKRLKINSMQDRITLSLNESPIAIELLETRLNQLERCLKILDHE